MTDDELTDLRGLIADLRGDMREGFAQLSGRVDTLAAARSGDHERLADALTDLAKNVLRVDDQVQLAHKRIDRTARADDVAKALSERDKRIDRNADAVHAAQISVAKLAGIASSGGVVGAALVEIASRILSGS